MPDTPYLTLLGDGATRTFTITHQRQTLAPVLEIFDATSGRRLQDGEYTAAVVNTNQLTLTFAVAPGSQTLRVLVFSAGSSPAPAVPPLAGGENAFFAAFNASLPTVEGIMGENFSYGGQSYPAVAIDELAVEGQQVMVGGRYRSVSVQLWVRREVVSASGIADDKIITVRGRRVRILSMPDEGDGTVRVNAGPVQVQTPDL